MLKKLEDSTAPDIDPGLVDSADRWLQCARCANDVTRADWAIAVDGAHHHTLFNPQGQVFRVRCFALAPGAVQQGDASDHFSWFKGFVWRFAHCRNCGEQVGWGYSLAIDSSLPSFFGLIAGKLKDSGADNA